MNTLVLILVVISSLCSAITSCTYAFIAWKKSKEPPRDEAWEAAIRLMCAKDFVDAEQFAEFYEQLAVYNTVMGKKGADRIYETFQSLQRAASMKDQTAPGE